MGILGRCLWFALMQTIPPVYVCSIRVKPMGSLWYVGRLIPIADCPGIRYREGIRTPLVGPTIGHRYTPILWSKDPEDVASSLVL